MTSKITFNKEIANTIGLEEAVLLEHLKQEESLHSQVSMQQICSDISFWSNEKIFITNRFNSLPPLLDCERLLIF